MMTLLLIYVLPSFPAPSPFLCGVSRHRKLFSHKQSFSYEPSFRKQSKWRWKALFPFLKSFHSMKRIFDETYGCIFCLNINLSIKLMFQVQWNLLTRWLRWPLFLKRNKNCMLMPVFCGKLISLHLWFWI